MFIKSLHSFYFSPWDILISLILAIMFAVSPQYIADGSVTLTGGCVVHAALFFIVYLSAVMVIRIFLRHSDLNISFFRKLLENRHSLIWLTLIMFLLWVPVLIILYPGTVINDTWGQFSQFIYTFYSGDKIQFEYLGDHHPVLTTIIMGWLIVPIANAIDNLQIAFFIYVLLQSFITCLALSCSLIYMQKKLQTGSGFIFAAFLIYSLLPVFPGSAQMIAKDSLNAWIFVFFTIFFVEIVRTKGESIGSAYQRNQFIIAAFALCATKKVSFYVVAISLFLLLLVIRKNRKTVGVILIAGVILFQAAWPMIMSAAGITSGGKTEMLSLPFQMTARYVKEHPDDIREDEYMVIDKMLYMDGLADRYDPVSADPVKGYAFYERFEGKDYVEYIKVWAAQGLRHPDSYWNALLAMESGWFSWTKYYPLMDMNWHSQLNPGFFSEASTVRPEKIGQLASGYQKLLDTLYKIPVIGVLFTYGLYAALIPAFVMTTLLTKRKKNGIHAWAAAMPMFLSLALGCWLAPVSIHFEGRRYLYPIIYTAAILIAFCCYWLRLEEEHLDGTDGSPGVMEINGKAKKVTDEKQLEEAGEMDGSNSSTDSML